MSSNELFCHISSRRLVDLIGNAERLVCYAAPGIREEPAIAMVDLARCIGPEALIVNLDVDERVFRMGYGDMEAVRRLRDAGIVIYHTAGLRSALVIVDQEGYIFTPTALYLEGESASGSPRNAMRLSPDQVREALARLSPAAKAIAIAQEGNPDTKEYIRALPVEVGSKPLDDSQFKQVDVGLEEAPPIKFNLARQVRVYEPYLQYVELELKGAAIQSQKVKIPGILQELGESKGLEGRLHTTLQLIKKDSDLSSKSLDDELRSIRDRYSPSLGKDHGRVILKRRKPELTKCLEDFRGKLEAHRQEVADKIQAHIDDSMKQVVDYYVPLVSARPPRDLSAQLPNDKPTEEQVRRWLKSELAKVFPKSQNLVKRMELRALFKDVTFETLNHDNFINLVKKAFPLVDWERPHKEFMAAKESNTDAQNE